MPTMQPCQLSEIRSHSETCSPGDDTDAQSLIPSPGLPPSTVPGSLCDTSVNAMGKHEPNPSLS